MSAQAAEPGRSWLYRLGGVSGLLLGVGYIVIIPVYVSVGVPPTGGEAWLEYSAGKTTAWWAILGLSVLTDLLFVPLGLALYFALRGISRDAMLLATAFVGLFVALDLAVTWSNYAALITLGDSYAAATTDAERAPYVAAATYASSVLTSTLEAVYSILTLSLGILIIGFVMLRSTFGNTAAWLGVATGILGIASVVALLLVSGVGAIVVILASTLTTAWVLVVGYRLYRLGGDGAVAR